MFDANGRMITNVEPYINITIKDVKNKLTNQLTEKDIAELYAICSNKYFWWEDELYDYLLEDKKYNKVLEIINNWEALYVELQNKIFNILEQTGIVIPKIKQIKVLKPFMQKYGYTDVNGWWEKENN